VKVDLRLRIKDLNEGHGWLVEFPRLKKRLIFSVFVSELKWETVPLYNLHGSPTMWEYCPYIWEVYICHKLGWLFGMTKLATNSGRRSRKLRWGIQM
jgi:hypothetical protein